MVLICNCFSQYFTLDIIPLANIKSRLGKWLICNRSAESMTSGLSDEEFHKMAENYIIKGSSSLLLAASNYYRFMHLMENVREVPIDLKEATSLVEKVKSDLKETVKTYSELIDFVETYGSVPESVKNWFAKDFDIENIKKFAKQYTLLSQDDVDLIIKTFKSGKPLDAVKLFRDRVENVVRSLDELEYSLSNVGKVDEKNVVALADKIWLVQKMLSEAIHLGSFIAMINITTRPIVENLRRSRV